MRVLFVASPSAGHVYPLFSLAWALRAAGHDVLLASSAAVAQDIRAGGLTAVATHGPVGTAEGMMYGRTFDESAGAAALMIGDKGLGEGYARLSEWAYPGTLRLARSWRPNLIVCEPTAFAGVLVAARLGIPLVEHRWGLRLTPEVAITAHARLAGLRADEDIPARPTPDLILDVCPPTLQYPDAAPARCMRYVPYNGGSAGVPDWVLEPADKPRLCLTLGTAIPEFDWAADLLRDLLTGLARLPVELVVAMEWAHLEKLGLSDQLPAEVRAAERIPLDLLLANCDAVVHHGGAGTMATGLVNGLAQVIIPHFGDQFCSAERMARTGAGIWLPVEDVTADTAAHAAASVLAVDGGHRQRAESFATEIAAQPTPAAIVAELADLAA